MAVWFIGSGWSSRWRCSSLRWWIVEQFVKGIVFRNLGSNSILLGRAGDLVDGRACSDEFKMSGHPPEKMVV